MASPLLSRTTMPAQQHPIVQEAASLLIMSEDERYTMSQESLDQISARLQRASGSHGLGPAVEGLARLAAYLRGPGASPTLAKEISELISARAEELRALRIRLCGTNGSEHSALTRFQRFAATPSHLHRENPGPTVRDFRVVFLAEREAIASAQKQRFSLHRRKS